MLYRLQFYKIHDNFRLFLVYILMITNPSPHRILPVMSWVYFYDLFFFFLNQRFITRGVKADRGKYIVPT